MALLVTLLDRALPAMGALEHLLVISVVGAAIYGAWLWLFARGTVLDAAQMMRR
jgi:hypothetical protein